MIQLREINRHNFFDIINLQVADSQKAFVATNVFSLAQAHAFPECRCLAIYQEETPVGFAMYCLDHDDGEYWIYRLMIDVAHQGKGYGQQAMERVIEEIQKDEERHVLYLSFEPENAGAKQLYEKLGFRADGRVIDGEIVYRLSY